MGEWVAAGVLPAARAASDHGEWARLTEEIARSGLDSGGSTGHEPVLKATADHLKPDGKAIAGKPTGNGAGWQERVIEDRREHRVSPRGHRPSLNRGRSQIRQPPGGDWRRWRDEQVKPVEEVCQAPEHLLA